MSHVTEHGAQQFINTIRVPPASLRKNSTRQYLMYCRKLAAASCIQFLEVQCLMGKLLHSNRVEPMCFLKHSETLA